MTTVVVDRSLPQIRKSWQPVALGAIVVLSLVLYGWRIGTEGWGNTFYSAAVKSMSQNLTNFLFGSFDPAGVVTVDKPPMAFWPQVLSTWIFGYHGWSLLLPQVVEGGLAVLLLHRTVRRWAGENVALLAALILAITPITVAINRDNNPDTLLTLWCVAAAYALTRSIEPGIPARSATKWLMQAAFWVGCGFVTKMLAGWMIVPAVALAYLAGRNASWGRRLLDLLGAGVVLLAASLWWVALTAWWPGQKPYIGGSTNGSAWDLIIGYNGLGRIFGQHLRHGGGAPGGTPGADFPGGGGFGSSESGLSRLFGESVGGQISWLIPLSLLVLVVVAVAGWRRSRRGLPTDHTRRGGWVLWGSWLLILGLVFSYQQGTFHSYYTTQLAPAIAAIVAAGLAVLWRYQRAPGPAWLLLPVGIVLTAGWSWVVISRDTVWNGWLRYAVAVAAVLAVFGLVSARLTTTPRQGVARPVMVFGLVAVLLAPAFWSAAKAFGGAEGVTGGVMPSAGPPGSAFRGFRQVADMPGMPDLPVLENIMRTGELPGGRRVLGAGLSVEQQRILGYTVRNAGGAPIVLAVEGGSMGSAGYIINSDVTVIGMGGFMGSDNAPSVALLSTWKTEGKLAFVLGEPPTTAGDALGRDPGRGGAFGRPAAALTERAAWIQRNCAAVPASAYGGIETAASATNESGGAPFGFGAQTLYDCLGR